MENENVSEQNVSVDTPPAQTLSGRAPIASGERILQHGSDDHRAPGDCQR